MPFTRLTRGFGSKSIGYVEAATHIGSAGIGGVERQRLLDEPLRVGPTARVEVQAGELDAWRGLPRCEHGRSGERVLRRRGVIVEPIRGTEEQVQRRVRGIRGGQRLELAPRRAGI